MRQQRVNPRPAITAPDEGISSGSIQLRAERSGNGNGRIYTVTASVQDTAGNSASGTGSCTVPHDQGKK